jgi:hypothetical protein
MRSALYTALPIALVLIMASTVSATELKVRGNLDIYGMWSANLNDHDSNFSDGDNYATTQRMRAYFDYVASENLKAVLGFEIDTVWGEGDADWGTDLNENGELEIKHAYMAFTFPDSPVHVQAGLQYVALPSVFGNPVFDDDAPAITVSAQINEAFGVTVGYTRGGDNSNNFSDGLRTNGTPEDDIDMAFIATPVTLEGFNITPYFGYAWVGGNAGWTATTLDIPIGEDTQVWVFGANAALTMYAPLTFAADLIYGHAESDDDLFETDGWYAALAATYKFDAVTATLFTTYATGFADDDLDDQDIMPTLAEGWGLTPYIGGVRAFSTSFDSFGTGALGIGNDGTGLWAMGLVLDDISFVDKLSHKLVLAYGRGTSDDDIVPFTEDDDCWEVYLVNKYMIYENLAAINELSYFKADSEYYEDATDDDLDASYFATIGLQYKF